MQELKSKAARAVVEFNEHEIASNEPYLSPKQIEEANQSSTSTLPQQKFNTAKYLIEPDNEKNEISITPIKNVSENGSDKPRSESNKPAKSHEKTEKKPKYDETTQPNAQKCRYSPYSFHRFARCHKEKLRDGSITMILRCRYCIEFQQVIIRFTKAKDGRYYAEKQVMPVNETIQNG